jgi:hypothetical protein
MESILTPEQWLLQRSTSVNADSQQDTVIQRYLPSLRWSPGVIDFLEKHMQSTLKCTLTRMR